MTKIISTVANMIILIEFYQHKEEIHWLYTSIHFRLFHSIYCPNFAQGRLPHFLRFEDSFLLTMLKVWVVIEFDNGFVEVDHAAYFSAAFNSWVHVAMYLYYLLAATIAKDENCRRKYLFWGK
jgi:hypothetical protein